MAKRWRAPRLALQNPELEGETTLPRGKMQATCPQHRLDAQSSGIPRRDQLTRTKHVIFCNNKSSACKQEYPFCSNWPAMDCLYPNPTLTLPLWHAYTVVLGWTSVTVGPICSPRDLLPWLCGIGLAAPAGEPVASSRCKLMVRSMEPDTTARSPVHGKKCTPKMFASC